MATGSAHPVLRFIRRLTVAGEEAPDAHLLARFVGQHDDAAFAALVRRHGPMVLGVCVRVLRDAADAEDAFQATFLVLVRRAASIGRPELLANWLYGVAYRTALKARETSLRQRRLEVAATLRHEAATSDREICGADVRPILDEELNRLPPRYRVPFVLCHLEGQTHDEIARQLGCPRATITTRLSRARERLRGRLTRRGVVLTASIAALLAGETGWATPLPTMFVENTVRSGLLFATGNAIPLKVALLTQGVLRAMFLTKVKIAAAMLLGVGIAVWGIHGLTPTPAAANPGPVAGNPAPLAPAVTEQDRPAAPINAEISVKALPPVVVRTSPQSGDTEVDAKAMKEIRVTFSKDMMDQSWSWSQLSDETFPKTTGKPSYDKDKRTCILPVNLEPGKTYAFWLNSEKFGNFKDADGSAAVPYLLVFETKK